MQRTLNSFAIPNIGGAVAQDGEVKALSIIEIGKDLSKYCRYICVIIMGTHSTTAMCKIPYNTHL